MRTFTLENFLAFGLFVLMLFTSYQIALPTLKVSELDSVLPHSQCFSYKVLKNDAIEEGNAPCLGAFATLKPLSISSLPTSSDNPQPITYFDIPNTRPAAHASSLVDISSISDKSFMLLYFAGTREGATDVGIYQSFYGLDSEMSESSDHLQGNNTSAPSTGKGAQDNSLVRSQDLAGSETTNSEANNWTKPHLILDAPTLSRLSGKFIKKLGNPVGFVDMQGRAHLFVVGVSLGGWATSKVYWLTFDKQLHSLRFVKELRLSPFLNFSHLVRTPPILKDDGGFYLPLYHELARKYPLVYEMKFHSWIDTDSSLSAPLGFHKVFSKDFAPLLGQLQPSFVALNKYQSFGIYRHYRSNAQAMQASICDATGCLTKPTNLTNYDSSSVLFSVGDLADVGQSKGEVFLLHNETNRANGNHREELWIYRLANQAKLLTAADSTDKVLFERVLRLDMLMGDEVSYPSAIVGSEGVMIAYTHGRKFIRTAFVPFEALGIKRDDVEAEKAEFISLEDSEVDNEEDVFALLKEDRAKSERWSVISWGIVGAVFMLWLLRLVFLRRYLRNALSRFHLVPSSPYVLLIMLGAFVLGFYMLFNLPFSSSFGLWSVREYAYGLFDMPSVMSVCICLMWLGLIARPIVLRILDSETSESNHAWCCHPQSLNSQKLIKTMLLCGLWALFGAVLYFGALGYDLLGYGLDIYHLDIRISLLIFVALGLLSHALNRFVGLSVVACLVAYSYDVMGAINVYHYMLDPFLWLGAIVGFIVCVAKLARRGS